MKFFLRKSVFLLCGLVILSVPLFWELGKEKVTLLDGAPMELQLLIQNNLEVRLIKKGMKKQFRIPPGKPFDYDFSHPEPFEVNQTIVFMGNRLKGTCSATGGNPGYTVRLNPGEQKECRLFAVPVWEIRHRRFPERFRVNCRGMKIQFSEKDPDSRKN